VALALVVACVGCGGSSRNVPLGTVADAGFRPPTNGFAFANYGDVLTDGTPPTNLVPADVRELFGDQVCVDAASGRCDLTPEAQTWLDATNAQMAGGHCYGFSVLASLLWDEKAKPSDFGASSTESLSIDGNVALQRQIAYDWALQLLESVQAKKVVGSPNDILDKLEQVLKPDPSEIYTMVFWKRDGSGGHAVTPYAVENDGDGHFRVLIYDNNWPGNTHEVNFDTRHDTWSYYATTQPNDSESLYEGDKDTKTLQLFPTTPAAGTQPCPFCGTVPEASSTSGAVGATGAPGRQEVLLLGGTTHRGNVMITDAAGHRLGYEQGHLIDQIKGAQADELAFGDWTDAAAPVFYVPADGSYTITLTDSGTADTESLEVIGPASDVVVRDISVASGDRDVLHVEPYASKVTYAGSRPESPALELSVNDQHADWTFTIRGVHDGPGATLSVALPQEGHTLAIENVGAAAGSVLSIDVARATSSGITHVHRDGVALAPGARSTLDFGSWPAIAVLTN
jgi:hypothetical protein